MQGLIRAESLTSWYETQRISSADFLFQFFRKFDYKRDVKFVRDGLWRNFPGLDRFRIIVKERPSMANGWNSGPDREAMLRRVAIVLSSLPGPVAADLLGEIDADTKKAVRRTMASLTDVDPLEQKRALHAFKISVQKLDELPDRFQSSVDGRTETGDTVQIRQQQVGNPGSRVVQSSMDSSKSADHAPHDPQNKTQPFAFIEHVSEQAVVHLLGSEHPQNRGHCSCVNPARPRCSNSATAR